MNKELVAPYAGAWIEIDVSSFTSVVLTLVAPYAGAWIEITVSAILEQIPSESLLMQERGLKSSVALGVVAGIIVAPYAGAWIEITA